jgi:hypothetical protein
MTSTSSAINVPAIGARVGSQVALGGPERLGTRRLSAATGDAPTVVSVRRARYFAAELGATHPQRAAR